MTPSEAISLLVAGEQVPDSALLLLLAPESPDSDLLLRSEAHRVRMAHRPPWVKRRALIEVSNICRNNCLYCGIRAANNNVLRYCLSPSTVIEAAVAAHSEGFNRFVLQGGEAPEATDRFITEMVIGIRRRIPESEVALSFGERPPEIYRQWREAGASRYLLREETTNPGHYRLLHPIGMDLDTRLRCHVSLREAGFRVGLGFLIGSPYQTLSDIVADLRYIARFNPGMIGMGPFIPADYTPLAHYPAGDLNLTFRCIALARILCPDADIPATTAISTLGGEEALEAALQSGANVVMPNFTPEHARRLYTLYKNKTRTLK